MRSDDTRLVATMPNYNYAVSVCDVVY